MPPPNYNFLNGVRFGLLALVILLQFSSCTQEEAEVISTDEMQLIRTFVDLDMAGKTTFDNLPLEADWEKARIGAETIEVPLINPVKSFESNLDNFQTRLVIPKADATQYRIISLESNFDHSAYLFTDLIGEERADSWVRWMKMDSDMRSLEVNSYLTISDPNANMPLDCTTVLQQERTCYYNGFSLIYCTDWEPVGSYQVCTSAEGGGGGGGGSNYKEDIIIKDPSFEGTKADCIFEKLVNSSEGFNKMIQKFDGEFPVSHLNFKLDYTMPDTINGNTSSSSIGSYYIDIKLNGNTLSDRPVLGVARTIAHETIHAEMYRKVKSVGGQVSMDDFPGIFYYYTNYKDWQHEQMANHYIDTFVDILKEFDNNQHLDGYYRDLAWEGLQGTQAWDSLPQSDKNRIIDNIINTNQNGSKICN